MEHARKMILVPQECFQQRRVDGAVSPAEPPTTTATTVQTPGTAISRLDEEMSKILNSSLDEREKCAKYEQTLQRFLRLIDEEKMSNFSPSIINSANKSGKSTPTIASADEEADNRILEVVPKKFRSTARQLIGRLRETDNITWDKHGLITLDGVLTGANIIDLVNEAMRVRKRPPPREYSQFARILHQAGVAREFVGNDRLWQEIASGVTPTTVGQERGVVHSSLFKQRKRRKLTQDTEAEEEEEEEPMDVEEGESQRQHQTSTTGRLKWIRMKVN
jgi:hypothetical protein